MLVKIRSTLIRADLILRLLFHQMINRDVFGFEIED